MSDEEKNLDEILHNEATFTELTKLYNKLFSQYGYIELSYFYDDIDAVSNYLIDMTKVRAMLLKKWEKTKSEDAKEDLSIMLVKLGDLIDISEKKWATQ